MRRLKITQGLALGGHLGLLALLIVWHAWLHPSQYFPVSLVLLVTAAPLLLPLRGMLHGRPKSHLWASFLMLLYFMHGTVEATVNAAQRLPALLEVVLSLLVFVSAALYARWATAANS